LFTRLPASCGESLFGIDHFPQRLKPPLILPPLRRGWKPRPFKAKPKPNFFCSLSKLHVQIGRATTIWGVACVLLMALSVSAEQAHDIHQLARAVDDHYNHLRSLQADFTEIYRGSGMDRTESGTLWLKKPRKMRWEYRSPKEKLFISDGKDVWFYLPAERQLRRTALKKLEDLRSPLAFLLGKTKLENELQGLSQAVDQRPLDPRNTLLRGVPQAMAERVSDVQLEITPSDQIVRIVLNEVDGTSTEFRFANWKENPGLTDDRFHFIPPPGVETVEGELGP
jgi:outer membrane lipoprotein carrier protein